MSLSVIIPVYNEERYLKSTLDSLKDQDFKKFETIIVCNGCTDKSFKIAKNFTNKVYDLKEKNVSKAKNYGAKKAKYDFLVFLDADVLLEKNVLENVHKVLLNGNYFGTVKGRGNGFKNFSYLKFKNIINKFKPWSHGFVYCHKKSFFNIGGFNENLSRGELVDFFSKINGKYKRVNAYVIPNDRRIKHWGISKLITYWLFDKNKKEYDAVR